MTLLNGSTGSEEAGPPDRVSPQEPVNDVQIPNLDVAGSIPVSRSFGFFRLRGLSTRPFYSVYSIKNRFVCIL